MFHVKVTNLSKWTTRLRTIFLQKIIKDLLRERPPQCQTPEKHDEIGKIPQKLKWTPKRTPLVSTSA